MAVRISSLLPHSPAWMVYGMPYFFAVANTSANAAVGYAFSSPARSQATTPFPRNSRASFNMAIFFSVSRLRIVQTIIPVRMSAFSSAFFRPSRTLSKISRTESPCSMENAGAKRTSRYLTCSFAAESARSCAAAESPSFVCRQPSGSSNFSRYSASELQSIGATSFSRSSSSPSGSFPSCCISFWIRGRLTEPSR